MLLGIVNALYTLALSTPCGFSSYFVTEEHSVIPLPQDYNVKELERHQGT